MRRRLTAAMVLMVLATLVLSGLVSLFLVQRATVDQTRHELVQEATGLATSVQEESSSQRDPAVALRNLLRTLQRSLRLDGFAVVGVSPQGQIFGVAPLQRKPALPSGLPQSDLSSVSLYELRTISGHAGNVVWAAVPYRAEIQILGTRRPVVQAVVLTRRPPTAVAVAGTWFGVSALVILAVAGLVASRLGRRFTAPIHAARDVATRIAAGDLEARVPDPPGADPELAGLAASINSMTESLARSKATERHFLQSVSHDLRTPLTSIRGFAEAIEEGATADVVAAAGVISSEARRLERLVGDLLALATLEARRFTLQPCEVDVAATAARTAAGFLPSASDLGLSLTVHAEAPAYTTADPDRLAQVMANLIENALRYARTAVQVGVSPGSAGAIGPARGVTIGPPDPILSGPHVWVTDDGPGIDPADLPRVFDRLFGARAQPDGASPQRPIGSGLGLTIVSELVRAMGGTVRAESPVSPAGGTCIVVSLPGARPRVGGPAR